MVEAISSQNTLPQGYLLQWYEIESVIGRGGFGITYLAHDKNLELKVAIKEYLPCDFADRTGEGTVQPRSSQQKELYEWGLERFISEARTLAKFVHPNIVRVLSVFMENNTAYMVMEYAEGQDLSSIYKRATKLEEISILDIFIPIIDGLALVHNHGFIHRDIKPANIYIANDSHSLLLDFGSARQSVQSKTHALTSLVTYGYAPFEQYDESSDKQGPWSDIYSIAASIYTGISGNRAIDALSRGVCFLDKGTDPYKPVSQLLDGKFSKQFLLAVDNALMFKASDRPSDILTWADMLLGKIESPELPDYMLQEANDDPTVVQFPKTFSNRVSKKLVDSSGRRFSGNKDKIKVAVKTSEIHSYKKVSPKKAQNHFPTKNIMRLLGFVIISIPLVILLVKQTPTDEPKPEKIAEKTQIETQKNLLTSLLNNAQQAITLKNYTQPELNNAYYYYSRVLKIENNNEAAIRGVNDIHTSLLALANNQYLKDNFTEAKNLLKQADVIKPNSKDSKKIQIKINTQVIKISTIKNLISKAQTSLIKKQYVGKNNKNARYYYKQVLLLEPNNSKAKKGLLDIKTHLVKLAKKNTKPLPIKKNKPSQPKAKVKELVALANTNKNNNPSAPQGIETSKQPKKKQASKNTHTKKN